MLVIHPKDKTTAMLSALYDGTGAKLIDESFSTAKIKHELNHVAKHETIMLLGHGSDKGLFCKDGDGYRLLVGHSHAYYLRQHRGSIIAVWCNADLFARAEGLHGMFTGMIISELTEAVQYGIRTSQDELDQENIKLAKRLWILLDKNVPLIEIPQRMLEMDDAHTPLTEFNYKNFHYL